MALFRPGHWVDDQDLIVEIDDTDPRWTYYGQSIPGNGTAAGYLLDEWRIWIITSDGKKYKADGEEGFFKVWGSRLSYAYS